MEAVSVQGAVAGKGMGAIADTLTLAGLYTPMKQPARLSAGTPV